jgi:hypothetical protein
MLTEKQNVYREDTGDEEKHLEAFDEGTDHYGACTEKNEKISPDKLCGTFSLALRAGNRHHSSSGSEFLAFALSELKRSSR